MGERKHKADDGEKKAKQIRVEEKERKGEQASIFQRNTLDPNAQSLLHLQSTIGNKAVSRLLAQTKQNTKPAGSQRKSRKPTSGIDISTTGETRIQRAPPVAAGIVAAVKALTLPELASIVGIATGVGAVLGTAITPMQGKTGMGPVMKLKFEGSYLLSEEGKGQLENITRALFYMEAEKILKLKGDTPTEKEKEEARETAIGNIKKMVVRTLDKTVTENKKSFVQNGEGGRTKVTPWGEAKVRLDGGRAWPHHFHEDVYDYAKRYGVTIDYDVFGILKTCLISYDFEHDVDPIWNDNIYVRGQDLEFIDDDGAIKVEATVAFDWDSDTTYYKWEEEKAMTPTRIAVPEWKGSKDPND